MEEFSQDWRIYKVVMHNDPPLCQRWQLDSCISLNQFFDMLEFVDAYQAKRKLDDAKREAEAKKRK